MTVYIKVMFGGKIRGSMLFLFLTPIYNAYGLFSSYQKNNECDNGKLNANDINITFGSLS